MVADLAAAPQRWRTLARPQLHDSLYHFEHITVQQVKDAAATLRKRKGFVGLHPRHFSWLSDSMLARLADLLNFCERRGV